MNRRESQNLQVATFKSWDGDDSVSHKDGEYIYVKADWHPNANKRGYVKRHRLVLEKKLGYYIPKRSIVHHKDEDKQNDDADNLELVPTQKLHSQNHDKGVRNTNGQFVASDPSFKEIKFRLFNKHTKQYEIYDLSKLIRTTFRNSQFTFAGRFTGLLDKNGKEIYYGDVVNVDQDEYFQIGFFEDTASFVGFGMHTGKVRWIENREKFRGEGQINLSSSEVIGNIHQNPELL